jgi:CheY-like chemotaxis protein
LSLTGNLEDLPLLDIIQIVSFSRKTGYLSIEMAGGEGGIVFREGLVVSAFTADSPPPDPRLSGLPPDRRDKAIRSRIGFALERLARLREGSFGFELTGEVPATLGTRDIALETLAGGINPQDLLLDLASGIDDARAESAAAVEASFATPEEGVLAEESEPVVPSAAFASDLAAPELAAPSPDESGDVAAAETAEAAIDDAVDRAFDAASIAAGADETGGEPAGAGPADYSPQTVPLPALEIPPEFVPASAPESPAAEAPPVQATPPAGAPEAEAPPAEARPAPGEPAPGVASPAGDAEAARAVSPTAPERPTGAGTPAGKAEPARTILLVDDEEDVRQILGRHFASAGFRIEEASDPDTAVKAAGRLREAHQPFVVVTDLGMPASGGASFHGGFEVVKRVWKMNLRPPVVMMTENLSQSLRLRARQMGIQAFVFKPTLSKLNPRQYEADLSAFAFKLSADLLPRLAVRASLKKVPHRRPETAGPAEPAPAAAPDPGEGREFEFLRRRLRELRQPEDANQIAVLVMKVAREFFERAILFVVKSDDARGLGGFGLAPREETMNLLARTITIPLGDPSVFHDVARTRRSFIGVPAGDRWVGHLIGRIGRFHSHAVAVLPLVAHRETIALLFGDCPETGREVGGLEALEVFVHQAGIALENVFLQKKLQAMQEKEGPGVR